MDPTTRARFQARAKVMKALAHPTRLLFVEELARGERCVCELNELVDADVSTISKHLSVLKHAGIVQDDKRGSRVFYILRTPCVLDFFSCVEGVLASAAKQQAELAS